MGTAVSRAAKAREHDKNDEDADAGAIVAAAVAAQERRRAVERSRVEMMRDYAEFGKFDLNWKEIERTGTADLVNFCCMVSPYGPAEKQLLLEADSLLTRAEALIAMAEIEMAKGGGKSAPLN